MSKTSRILSLARNRRPVREFADRPLPPETVESVLEAGRWAPSAKEAQPWRFVAVQEALTRRELAAAAFNHPHVATAPLLVVCCARIHSHVSGSGRVSYPMDLAAAAQNMLLAAADMGLSTSWINGFRESAVRDAVDAPSEVPVVTILAIGYADGIRSLPDRRPWDEVVAWERWKPEES